MIKLYWKLSELAEKWLHRPVSPHWLHLTNVQNQNPQTMAVKKKTKLSCCDLKTYSTASISEILIHLLAPNVNFKTVSACSTRIGVSNETLLSMLHIVQLQTQPLLLFLVKNVNGTGFQNAFVGYTESFYCIFCYWWLW